MLKKLVKKSGVAVALVRACRRVSSIIIGKKERKLQCVVPYKLVAKKKPEENWFCGYYDHSPFNCGNESLILIHSTSHPAWRKPSPRQPVTILVYDWRQGNVVSSLGATYSWNWQQGARAIWLNSDTVVYNTYDKVADAYKARFVGVDGVIDKELPIPVQEVDNLGRVYSISYEVLSAIRPDYGYRNRTCKRADLDYNAIIQYDPMFDRYLTIVDLQKLKSEVVQRVGDQVSYAKFNHVMANPGSTRVIFLLRYYLNGRRVTDLFSVPTHGGQAELLVADSGVSHACWECDDNVIATMSGDEGFGYYRIPLNKPNNRRMILAESDGHPTKLNDEYLLTDTYPNKFGVRDVRLLAIGTKRAHRIACTPEPLLFQGETRCDLHPSPSQSGRYIQFDCAIGQRRTIAIIENPLLANR